MEVARRYDRRQTRRLPIPLGTLRYCIDGITWEMTAWVFNTRETMASFWGRRADGEGEERLFQWERLSLLMHTGRATSVFRGEAD